MAVALLFFFLTPPKQEGRPALFYLLCNGMQPTYATMPGTIGAPSTAKTSLQVHAAIAVVPFPQLALKPLFDGQDATRTALVSGIMQGLPSPDLLCYTTVSWQCDTFASYDPQYAACWEAAIMAQSPLGLSGVTPCDDTHGWFALGGQTTFPLDRLDPSKHWSRFATQLRGSLDASAADAIQRVDYVTSPLREIGAPTPLTPLTSVPVISTRPVAFSQQVAVEGSNMDAWLGQLCDASLGGGALSATPQQLTDATLHATKCLLNTGQQHLDVDNHLQSSSTATITITDEGQPVVFDACEETGFMRDRTRTFCYYASGDTCQARSARAAQGCLSPTDHGFA